MFDRKKILRLGNNQIGFSLVELMIAIVLGMLVTAAVTAMTVKSLTMNSDTLKSARLNQELSAVMQIMSSELARAGYSGPAGELYGDTNRDGTDDEVDVNIDTASCALYSYNRDITTDTIPPHSKNKIDHTDRSGFKRAIEVVDGENIGVLQMRTMCDASSVDCDDCDQATWETITDPNAVNVTGLAFTSTGSKCRNVKDEAYWSVDGASETGFACTATSANVCLDADGDGVYVCGTAAPPAPLLSDPDPRLRDDHRVDVRQVNITLTGELTNDSSVSKDLQASVKIMNHMVRYVPGT